MAVVLDHILWAAPDLDAGTDLITRLTGVTPAKGGSHPGFGTRNSLLSLGETYLEIISPDPAQSLDGNRGGRIAAMSRPGLITFAVRSPDLQAYADATAAAGIATRGPTAMSRTRPDGVRLDWSVLNMEDARHAEVVPFAIDWQGSAHPSTGSPQGCRLKDFVLLHPEAAEMRRLYAELSIPVEVLGAPDAGFAARIATPNGDVMLTGAGAS